MATEQRLRRHRTAWLACYPTAAFTLLACIAFRTSLGTGPLLLVAFLLPVFPLGLWANCGTGEQYKARTYLYVAMLYVTGWLLLGAVGLMAVIALGNGNWK